MEEDRTNLEYNVQESRRNRVDCCDLGREFVEYPNLHTVRSACVGAGAVHTVVSARVEAVKWNSAFLETDEAGASVSEGLVEVDHSRSGATILLGLRLPELGGMKRTDISLDQRNCIEFEVITGFLVLNGFFRQRPAANSGLLVHVAVVKTTARHEGTCIGCERDVSQPPPVMTLINCSPVTWLSVATLAASEGSTAIASEPAWVSVT